MTACTLPRGAPIEQEVIANADAEDADFQVVEITRDALDEIGKWQPTGWKGHYYWLAGSHGLAAPLIQAGDQIDLTIWDSQDNSLITAIGQRSIDMTGLQVSSDGTIFMPYAGEVLVRGTTPDVARELIQDKLEAIVPSAQVQLQVNPGLNNTADLVGGVNSPGRIALAGRNVTLLSILAEAGGIRNDLKNPLVRLIRGGKTYEIRAEDLFSKSEHNIVMRSGDKIIVDEDKRYFVALGATGSEELVYFTKERITAIEALSMLGGLSDSRANPQGILVLREYPESAQRPHVEHGPDMRAVVFTFDLTSADGLFAARNFQINPLDTVMATESPVNAARTIMGLLGSAVGIAKQF